MPAWQLTRTPLALQLPQPTFTKEELLTEQWREILGYEGHYQVSDLGRVKSMKNYHGFMPNRILRVSPEGAGYLKVTLSLHSVLRTRKIHQLVAEAFIGPRPDGYEINHKDGCKGNNRAENLEYVTKKGNMEHASRNGLCATGDRHGLRKWKNAAASGDDNGFRKHPEAIPRGDAHYSRRTPEKVLRGEKNGAAKLTQKQAEEIRRIYREVNISMKLLGSQYGVCADVIHKIVHQRTYRTELR